MSHVSDEESDRSFSSQDTIVMMTSEQAGVNERRVTESTRAFENTRSHNNASQQGNRKGPGVPGQGRTDQGQGQGHTKLNAAGGQGGQSSNRIIGRRVNGDHSRNLSRSAALRITPATTSVGPRRHLAAANGQPRPERSRSAPLAQVERDTDDGYESPDALSSDTSSSSSNQSTEGAMQTDGTVRQSPEGARGLKSALSKTLPNGSAAVVTPQAQRKAGRRVRFSSDTKPGDGDTGLVIPVPVPVPVRAQPSKTPVEGAEPQSILVLSRAPVRGAAASGRPVTSAPGVKDQNSLRRGAMGPPPPGPTGTAAMTDPSRGGPVGAAPQHPDLAASRIALPVTGAREGNPPPHPANGIRPATSVGASLPPGGAAVNSQGPSRDPAPPSSAQRLKALIHSNQGTGLDKTAVDTNREDLDHRHSTDTSRTASNNNPVNPPRVDPPQGAAIATNPPTPQQYPSGGQNPLSQSSDEIFTEASISSQCTDPSPASGEAGSERFVPAGPGRERGRGGVGAGWGGVDEWGGERLRAQGGRVGPGDDDSTGVLPPMSGGHPDKRPAVTRDRPGSGVGGGGGGSNIGGGGSNSNSDGAAVTTAISPHQGGGEASDRGARGNSDHSNAYGSQPQHPHRPKETPTTTLVSQTAADTREDNREETNTATTTTTIATGTGSGGGGGEDSSSGSTASAMISQNRDQDVGYAPGEMYRHQQQQQQRHHLPQSYATSYTAGQSRSQPPPQHQPQPQPQPQQQRIPQQPVHHSDGGGSGGGGGLAAHPGAMPRGQYYGYEEDGEGEEAGVYQPSARTPQAQGYYTEQYWGDTQDTTAATQRQSRQDSGEPLARERYNSNPHPETYAMGDRYPAEGGYYNSTQGYSGPDLAPGGSREYAPQGPAPQGVQHHQQQQQPEGREPAYGGMGNRESSLDRAAMETTFGSGYNGDVATTSARQDYLRPPPGGGGRGGGSPVRVAVGEEHLRAAPRALGSPERQGTPPRGVSTGGVSSPAQRDPHYDSQNRREAGDKTEDEVRRAAPGAGSGSTSHRVSGIGVKVLPALTIPSPVSSLPPSSQSPSSGVGSQKPTGGDSLDVPESDTDTTTSSNSGQVRTDGDSRTPKSGRKVRFATPVTVAMLSPEPKKSAMESLFPRKYRQDSLPLTDRPAPSPKSAMARLKGSRSLDSASSGSSLQDSGGVPSGGDANVGAAIGGAPRGGALSGGVPNGGTVIGGAPSSGSIQNDSIPLDNAQAYYDADNDQRGGNPSRNERLPPAWASAGPASGNNAAPGRKLSSDYQRPADVTSGPEVNHRPRPGPPAYTSGFKGHQPQGWRQADAGSKESDVTSTSSSGVADEESQDFYPGERNNSVPGPYSYTRGGEYLPTARDGGYVPPSGQYGNEAARKEAEANYYQRQPQRRSQDDPYATYGDHYTPHVPDGNRAPPNGQYGSQRVPEEVPQPNPSKPRMVLLGRIALEPASDLLANIYKRRSMAARKDGGGQPNSDRSPTYGTPLPDRRNNHGIQDSGYDTHSLDTSVDTSDTSSGMRQGGYNQSRVSPPYPGAQGPGYRASPTRDGHVRVDDPRNPPQNARNAGPWDNQSYPASQPAPEQDSAPPPQNEAQAVLSKDTTGKKKKGGKENKKKPTKDAKEVETEDPEANPKGKSMFGRLNELRRSQGKSKKKSAKTAKQNPDTTDSSGVTATPATTAPPGRGPPTAGSPSGAPPPSEDQETGEFSDIMRSKTALYYRMDQVDGRPASGQHDRPGSRVSDVSRLSERPASVHDSFSSQNSYASPRQQGVGGDAKRRSMELMHRNVLPQSPSGGWSPASGERATPPRWQTGGPGGRQQDPNYMSMQASTHHPNGVDVSPPQGQYHQGVYRNDTSAPAPYTAAARLQQPNTNTQTAAPPSGWDRGVNRYSSTGVLNHQGPSPGQAAWGPTPQGSQAAGAGAGRYPGVTPSGYGPGGGMRSNSLDSMLDQSLDSDGQPSTPKFTSTAQIYQMLQNQRRNPFVHAEY